MLKKIFMSKKREQKKDDKDRPKPKVVKKQKGTKTGG